MKHLKKYETYITEELREEEKRMLLDTSLKNLLPGRIFTTEFMNKLNNNKDLILPSEYSMKSVSEIKINTIQFIVEKIH